LSSPTPEERKTDDKPMGDTATYHSQAGILTGGNNGVGMDVGACKTSQRTKENTAALASKIAQKTMKGFFHMTTA